jgi:hypothetical protein
MENQGVFYLNSGTQKETIMANHKKFTGIIKGGCFLALFTLALPAFAESREDIQVYIAPVVASPDQASYFRENFTTETIGAGYIVTQDAKEADYTLNLEVKPNLILYDDGTIEQAPPDEKQYILHITLMENEDNSEVVAFSFAFTSTDEMYDFNLYLIYEAMANVPMTKLGAGTVITDHWRNKWLYLRASFDYPITFYQLKEPNVLMGDGPHNPVLPLDNKISPFPAVTIGLELQYLNWLSTELSFNLSFADPFGTSFIPAIQIEQKFPIKPSRNFMIEPYAAVSFPVATTINSIQFPKVGIGGGVQLGVRGGEMGAFFVDVNYIHFLGDVIVKNPWVEHYPNPDRISYTRFVIGLGIGYKIGFFNRNKDVAANP